MTSVENMSILNSLFAFVFGTAIAIAPNTSIVQEPVILSWHETGIMQCEITRRQEVWKNALQWHESRAILEAKNPKDRDGTPSWGPYQFKPGTVKNYGVKYKMLRNDLTNEEYIEYAKDIEFIDEIVDRMFCDSEVKWEREFPVVVLEKIGFPPKD